MTATRTKSTVVVAEGSEADDLLFLPRKRKGRKGAGTSADRAKKKK